ncbi:MAG: hypothetical protein ACOYN2_03425 [Patescibacteria group bacterium]
MIRRFQVHFPQEARSENTEKTKHISLGCLLSKEIKALEFLDKKVF